jgi:pimeloyl-ACP methyl ester carboxylesterase
MHPVIGLVAFAVACLALLFAGVTIATMRLLTRPPRRTYATALASGRPGDPSELPAPSSQPNHIWAWKKWTLHTLGLDLPVWEIEGLHASGPTIILTHGWGDSRIGALARISSLAPIASRLIAWDMPGHGDAPGTCSLGTNEVDALSNLIERLTAGTHAPIILLGWSLGAGVSIASAAKRRERQQLAHRRRHRRESVPPRAHARRERLAPRTPPPLPRAENRAMAARSPRTRPRPHAPRL